LLIRRLKSTALLVMTFAGTHAVAAQCDQDPIQAIPHRAADAPAGSEFARTVESLSGPQRDAQVRSQVLSGNVPQFLRHLAPVTVTSADSTITVCVLPDYLAVGSDKDFVFVPLGLEAALDIAERFGFELPTPKLVDAIYQESAVKLAPQPLPASDQMRSTDYVVHHTQMITRQRSELGAPLGELTAGDKKDLVLTSLLWQNPGRVAIYGWHKRVDEPIQPLSTVHGARYADYSHGIRLVSSIVYVNGIKRSIDDVLAEPRLAGLLTREGPLTRIGERLSALMARMAKDPATATASWLQPIRESSSARR
jgi:hypothetical protein